MHCPGSGVGAVWCRPSMTDTREEVLALAKAMFGEGNLAEVLTVLDAYGTESHEREVNRVKLAILELSKGRKETLLHWVKIAKLDYRDPLAARELGPLTPEEGAKLQTKARNLIDRWGGK